MEWAIEKDAAKTEKPLLPPPGRFASYLEKSAYAEQQERLAIAKKGIT